jgi:hypothetical protein
MARGWESKGVESQIEEAQSARRSATHGLSAEQITWLREKESLQLSRTRVLHDLERARNPRHQAILKQALDHLEQKLREYDENKPG